ncbi:MAG: gluconate 2-dehydrogenase subunit 3 family protein [Bryobacterales bacterium]|nr:gluconate 2-dehydrogenase subunit 3 family protein [Bryobacterales bacterium]
MSINRRAAIAVAGWAALETRLARARQPARVFTPREVELLDPVSEMISPADRHSPGARAAGVSEYIHLIAANSPPEDQQRWRGRVQAFAQFAEKSQGKPFQALGPAQRKAVLASLAPEESHPRTEAGHFFADMKQITISAYYTSRIGLPDELEHKGNQAMSVFPVCAQPIKGHA